MLRNRFYTEEQVLQVVDEVLCRLDSTQARDGSWSTLTTA